jgi:hypothetical protein
MEQQRISLQEQLNLQLLSLQVMVDMPPYPGHLDALRHEVALIIELFNLMKKGDTNEHDTRRHQGLL